MEEEFVSLVGKALELVRKRDHLRLGKHDIAHLTLVQHRAQPSDPPTRLGRIVTELLGELLNTRMRPDGPTDIDRIDWRRFVLLEQYVFRARTMGETLEDLNIGEALFFDTKREAIETLADELWLGEQRAREEVLRTTQNIPEAEFAFIPRVDDQGRDLVEHVLGGLQKRPWVVSVRGFGGVGKSTLAIEAAWEAVRRGLFNRVCWVRMAPTYADSSELLGHILDTVGKTLGSRSVLGVDEIDEQRDLVLRLLSEVKALVVIDNTENVPGQQHDQIVQFVRDLPLPTCALIVSREMQRKSELETMIHLEGMTEKEALPFLEARAAEQSIALSDQQAGYLFDITRGNPRAMLFALGWMVKYGLPAEDVLDGRMQEVSALLDNLLGRVYERLDEDEELTLNVMPLFAEPVPRSPIAAASGLAGQPARVKAALGNLHARFLVDVDAKKQYSIAPLTNIFLRERADKAGARTGARPARDFWANAYDRLIEHCLEEFQNAKPYERIDFVRSFRQTILDQMRWAADHRHDRQLTDLMFYVGGPLGELGYWRNKLTWGESALQAAETIGDHSRVAWHRIFDLGWTHFQRGDVQTAEEILRKGLAQAEKQDYGEGMSIALRNLAQVALRRGQHETAVSHLERSISVAEAHRLPVCLALAKATLGEVKLRLEEPDHALQLFKATLHIYEEVGDSCWQSIALSQMADAMLALGHHDEALESLQRALALVQEIPDPSRAQARALLVKGKLQAQQGMADEARELFEQSLDIYRRLGQVIMVEDVQTQIDELTKQVDSANAD
jgi:tetratricopeptide (TPR) repeat protein